MIGTGTGVFLSVSHGLGEGHGMRQAKSAQFQDFLPSGEMWNTNKRLTQFYGTGLKWIVSLTREPEYGFYSTRYK